VKTFSAIAIDYDYSHIARQEILLLWSVVPKRDLARIVSAEVLRLLREERIRRGVSMNHLAEKSGVSQSMISLLERGQRNPTLDILIRMAAPLNVDLWKLIKKASTAALRAKVS